VSDSPISERAPDTAAQQRRNDALRTAARARTATATARAEKGIRTLIRDGGRINFTSVARASGVSARFLHHHHDLAARIRTLAAQQRGALEERHAVTVTGDNAVIAALRRRLREQDDAHRAETARLRTKLAEQDRQLAALYGQLRGRPDHGSPRPVKGPATE